MARVGLHKGKMKPKAGHFEILSCGLVAVDIALFDAKRLTEGMPLERKYPHKLRTLPKKRAATVGAVNKVVRLEEQ